jgi:hypothetical protein
MSSAAKTAGGAEAKASVGGLTRVRAPLLQRECSCAPGKPKCDSCEQKGQEKKVQRAAKGANGPVTAPPSVDRTLASPGRPLEPSTRSFMEPRFGRDFSDVRVHTDAASAESARAVNANAYTVGQHIVFDQGKYEPSTQSGKQLLAHELAHTVQQSGLQRSSDALSLNESSEYHRSEREAESASEAVMSGPGIANNPRAISARPSAPMVSRVTKPTAESVRPPEEGVDSVREWESPSPALSSQGVKSVARPKKDAKDKVSDKVGIYKMGKLQLPNEKGPVLNVWKPLAGKGQLQAAMLPGAEEPASVEGQGVYTKSALKQKRPGAKQLRGIWLQKVGWSPNDANDKWKDAAKKSKIAKNDATTSFEPCQVDGSPCQVDHIVELQFGGSSDRQNLQMLDGDENQAAGRNLFIDLKNKSEAIRNAQKAAGNEVSTVILSFEDVDQGKSECTEKMKCCSLESWVMKNALSAAPDESNKGQSGKPYPLRVGALPETSLIIPEKEWAQKKDIPIYKSSVGENRSAATLVSGFLLQKLTISGAGMQGKDEIFATLDARKGTAIPESLTVDKSVQLNVQKDGTLKLPSDKVNLKFHYPYLSEGTITRLEIEKDGSISGAGSIKPSIPFLPLLNVKFDKDSFELVAPLDAKRLKSPIPGAKITEGEFGLKLAPEFKPYGTLGFELATGAKKILDGKVEVTADAQGLLATGKLHAFLPGVDNAEGDIKYQNKEWTGGVKIEATQLRNKLKYVKSGTVTVGFSGKGVSAEGKVLLDIPGTKGVEASLLYESSKHRWLFRGKGAFEPPRLKPVEIELEYDGDHLSGEASTGFEFHGINGNIRVRYRDEKFSGEGKLEIHKGKANGFLHVVMHPFTDKPKFSGEGEVSYQLTENLVAKAGISIDEQEKVRLKGALEFPKPIELFKPIKGDYKIFEIGISIPIPGASIGPVGLKARIDGALSAGYQLGPGELRNTKLEAAFNPLDEKPDLDVVMTSTLYVGASAHITGKISGSIVVDAVIASVSGGLTISATALLDGHVASEVTLHYQQSRFEVDAKFELLVGLAIILALDAFVKAKAGIGPFSVEKEKVWNLASFKYDTGLQFGFKLKKPLHYASDQALKLPSLDDLEWTVPKLDPGDILKHSFGGAGSKESEKGS